MRVTRPSVQFLLGVLFLIPAFALAADGARRTATPAAPAAPAAKPTPDRAADTNIMIGVSVGTEHVGAERDFDETNPGAFINVSRTWPRISGNAGLEAGVFENSFSELSATINGWIEWPVLGRRGRIPGQLSLGTALGLARYPNLVDEARDLGLPTIANFVPFIAAQASWATTERLELRMRATPIGGDADFVLGLQLFLRL